MRRVPAHVPRSTDEPRLSTALVQLWEGRQVGGWKPVPQREKGFECSTQCQRDVSVNTERLPGWMDGWMDVGTIHPAPHGACELEVVPAHLAA